uniref:Spindle pole body component n=1 Tax=Albugo laibachii Nc14 TaxID=890382 RepID=F0WA44_9STRA|nr:conserved hypothetical protein [Albugo laibachii Nc14]|eukprot:CCA18014.1 conserved hypothetical protein [Albugo laibachii Nc14]
MAPPASWMHELRPLGTDLCVAIARSARKKRHINTLDDNTVPDANSSEIDRIESEEIQSLRVEKLLLDLFTHNFIEKSQKQVQRDFDELLYKVEIHSEPEKARKMRILASQMDTKVLQLLMELSRHPSRQIECIDPQMEDTLTEIQRDQSLVSDLMGIASKDAWFDDWTDSADEDDAMDIESFHSGTELEQDEVDSYVSYNSSLKDIDAFNKRRQDRLLQRYYRVAGNSDDKTSEDALDLNMTTDLHENNRSCRFKMDDPCTLFHSIHAGKPVTFIREEALVHAAFYALLGLPSHLFEFTNCSTHSYECFFGGGFVYGKAQLTDRAKHTAVPHLSLKALHQLLEFFVETASYFCFLRDFQAFVQRDTFDLTSKSVVLEGFTDAISSILCSMGQRIVRVQSRLIQDQDLDREGMENLDRRFLHPTLLSVKMELDPTLKKSTWLSFLVRKCIQPFEIPRASIEPGKMAVTILNALYEVVQRESLTLPAQNLMRDKADHNVGHTGHFDTSFRLFTSSLEPYLKLLERTLFTTSFNDSFLTPSELFVDRIDREIDQCQQFTIQKSLVPGFLHENLSSLEEAITSRCILNTFRQQRVTESPQNDTLDLAIGDRSVLLPFSCWMEAHVVAPIAQKCATLNGEIAAVFRTELCLLERIKSLRLLKLGEYLLQRMSRYGSAWMDRESLNTHFQETLDDLHADRLISEASCQFGSQVYIHLDVQALAEVSTQPPLSMLETPPALTPFIRECKVDIRSIRIITFSLAVPPPLHLLLGKNVLAKYSQISAFILQAKVVQVALFAIRRRLQEHKMAVLHDWRLHIASMWHYNKCFQLYLQSQVTSSLWKQAKSRIKKASSLSEMHQAQVGYLDPLLERFFLLEKTLHQYIIGSLHHILSFVHDFQSLLTLETASLSPEDDEMAHKFLQQRMRKSAAQWHHKVHFQIVTLEAMYKHGRSPHVHELHTALNYNSFHSQKL